MTLPKFEDWKAPWEVDLKEGDDPTFDFVKGKQYLYNVLSDKEKAQKQVDKVTAENTSLKDAAAEKAREGESTEQKLTRERDEALEKARKAGEKSIETLKLEVALDKGLNKTQAKRLVGTTKEELEADADEIILLMPGKTAGEEGEEGEFRFTPGSNLKSAGTGGTSKVSAFDAAAEADAYNKRNSFL